MASARLVRSCCVLVLLFFAMPGVAQETPVPDAKAWLAQHNAEAVRVNQTAMGILFGWAVLNIGTGVAGHFASEGETRAFFQANAAWNVVNLVIAGLGYHGQATADPASWDLARSLSEGQRMEKVLLLNAGLDVGYIAFGGFLWERGMRKDSERLRGWGKSVLMQGAFLLVFDGVLTFLNAKLNGELTARLVPAPDGVGLMLTWP
ncbi:hypothetical protein D7Y27_25460 [Corallococcus sp. AB004]|uniref:DUF6992 family protein n=1 Tax=Corallococcus exiguus TaxID=83462 RepID=UPI000EA14904|nr:hypothetical protein [Corallococcus exiguus]NPC73393.1 hypothetical protein [Corallococcus exiguus]NRD47878.1 hypothetical protein [Corallococcus exiguus]RKI37507.1 hypothetical protein D7Y27_25460 [Corallococcus sp. AB004]